MLALAFSGLLALAAVWTVRSDSGALVFLVNICALGVVLLLGLASLARQPRVLRSMITSLTLLTLPLLWYVYRLAIESNELVAGSHWRLLVSDVLPGLVYGALTALGISNQATSGGAVGEHVRWRWLDGMLVANTAIVVAIAAYLASNTGGSILLISAEFLLGAESYQVLGDALTLNLLVAYIMTRFSGWQRYAASGPLTARQSLLGLLGIASLGCAVLSGSNKLLLMAAIVSSLALATAARPSISKHPWLWSMFAAAVVAAIVYIGVAVLEQLTALAAQTRLLDYGNVTSLLENPSIAARLAILSECGVKQFSLAPLLGNLGAEYFSCGEGEYLHSIVSVQTHLGLIGSGLVAACLLRGAWILWATPRYRSVRSVYLLILLVALVAAFFTWMPFWFLLGLTMWLPVSAGTRSHSMRTLAAR